MVAYEVDGPEGFGGELRSKYRPSKQVSSDLPGQDGAIRTSVGLSPF